jgi:hypothetical protein
LSAIHAARPNPAPIEGVEFVRSEEPRQSLDAARRSYLMEKYFQREVLKPGEPGVLDLLHEAREHRT